MRFKRIEIINNPILWNKNFNFVDDGGNFFNTLLLIWENWSWKSTFLKIIYSITNISEEDPHLFASEVRRFFVYDELTNKDYTIVLDSNRINNIAILDKAKNLYAIIEPDNERDKHVFWSSYEQHVFVEENWIYNEELTRKLICPEWSNDLSINSVFITPEINDIWAKNTNSVFKDFTYSMEWTSKINEKLNDNIKTLLISLCIADNDDVVNYIKDNRELPVPVGLIDKRINIFKNAINILFADTKIEFVWIKNLTPVFEKNWNTIEIEQLSLWEKEIILKGWFLLLNSFNWAKKISLIDEPETWLHPRWQLKIIQYYKNILTNSIWSGDSQLFITTHSPFILQWAYDNFDAIISFPACENINNLNSYIWNKPSISVINYLVYGIPTIELHDELYWYIQSQSWKTEIKDLELFFKQNWLVKIKPWTQEIYEKGVLKKRNIISDCSLQSFIRNKSHHPENQIMSNVDYSREELKESIDEMINLIDNLFL